MKKLATIFLAAILLFSCKQEAEKKETSEENKKTNVLLIVADDLGEEVGCYGDPFAITPNMDKFASEGLQFTNAYVTQASCSPSRSSILTGLYPHQNGQVGLSHLGISMNKQYPSLFSILKGNGYRTGIIGKLHVEPYASFPYDYGMGGFDTNDVMLSKEQLTVNVINEDGKEVVEKEKFTRFHMPAVADSASAFIDRGKEKPFFLMLNFLDPHRPFKNRINGHPKKMLSAEDIEIPKYFSKDSDVSMEEVVGYYNGVTRFDEGLGYVLEMLDKKGIRDNTLIIVLGDHGAPLDRAKTTSYEAGLRIPMLVQFPDNKYSGMKNETFVSTLDILPTILDQLNINELPKDAQGISWLQLLDNKVKPRTYIAGEYTQHLPEHLFPQRTIREGDFKLIYNPMASFYKENFKAPKNTTKYDLVKRYKEYAAYETFELYDLSKDPHEFNNIAEDPVYQNQLASLTSILKDWQRGTDDPLLKESYQEEIKKEIKKYIDTNF